MFLYLDEIFQENTTQISETQIQDPTLPQIFEAFEKLDQKRHTLLSLETEPESLMVGAGPDKFILIRTNRSSSYSLLREGKQKTSEKVMMCVGGQMGDYPENMVIHKSQAIQVITAFFEGKHDGFNWVND